MSCGEPDHKAQQRQRHQHPRHRDQRAGQGKAQRHQRVKEHLVIQGPAQRQNRCDAAIGAGIGEEPVRAEDLGGVQGRILGPAGQDQQRGDHQRGEQVIQRHNPQDTPPQKGPRLAGIAAGRQGDDKTGNHKENIDAACPGHRVTGQLQGKVMFRLGQHMADQHHDGGDPAQRLKTKEPMRVHRDAPAQGPRGGVGWQRPPYAA